MGPTGAMTVSLAIEWSLEIQMRVSPPLNGYVVAVFIRVCSTGHSDLVIYSGLNDQRVCEGVHESEGSHDYFSRTPSGPKKSTFGRFFIKINYFWSSILLQMPAAMFKLFLIGWIFDTGGLLFRILF